MLFRNYCVIFMGDNKDVLSEILRISETTPNTLDAKGIFIATFTSVVKPKELTDFFKLNNRNFMFFDLNSEYSGFSIIKPDIENALFGFLNDMTNDKLKQKADMLIKEINISVDDSMEIENLSTEQRNILINELLDKGIDNLTKNDKILLDKLSNY